MKLTCEISE